MSAVSAIYKAKPEVFIDEKEIMVTIQYNSLYYHGFADLNPKDKDFYSERVGTTIALSRARIDALKDALKEARNVYKYKYQFYHEIANDGWAEVNNFLGNVEKARKNMKRLQEALKAEKRGLNAYLKSQEKMIQTVRQMRMD